MACGGQTAQLEVYESLAAAISMYRFECCRPTTMPGRPGSAVLRTLAIALSQLCQMRRSFHLPRANTIRLMTVITVFATGMDVNTPFTPSGVRFARYQASGI